MASTGPSPSPQLLLDPAPSVSFLDIGEDELHPSRAKRSRHREPDPARATRNHRDPVFELLHGSSVPNARARDTVPMRLVLRLRCWPAVPSCSLTSPRTGINRSRPIALSQHLLRRHELPGFVPDPHARRRHPDQSGLRAIRAGDPRRCGEARLRIFQYQNHSHQPRR